MNTKSQIYKFGVSLLVVLVGLVACKKKEDGQAETPTYRYLGGVCYNSQNQVVAPQFCVNVGGNPGYYLQNGQCFSPQGQPVQIQLCQSANHGGYYMNNGYCYNSQGVSVPNSFCSNSGYNSGYYFANGYCYNLQGTTVPTQFCQNINGGIGGLQCYGNYIYRSGYWTQMIYCNGADCQGLQLIEISTNRSVTCR